MHKRGFIAVLLAAMIWGGGYIATSSSLDSFSPLMMLAIRFTLGALILASIQFNQIRVMSKKDVLMGIPLGIFLFAAFFFQTIGVKYTSVANNSFLSSLSVIITPYFMWLIYRQKPSSKILLASILSIVGVSLLTVQEGFSSINVGDLYTLLGSIFFSLHVIWSQRCYRMHHIQTSFMQMIVSGILASFFALVTDQFYVDWSIMTQKSMFSLIYLIFLSTLLAYIFQMYASRTLEPSVMSIMISTEALFATLFSVVFFGDRFAFQAIFSMFLISIAIMISALEESKIE